MEFCLDSSWELCVAAVLAMLGALTAVRIAASAVMHATMAATRFLIDQPMMGERSAPHAKLRDPTIYCTQYGDKYHVD
eukprot:5618440-Alexandrium_andersonii.AAC.1